MTDMRTVAVIPMKLNNRRLPGKNTLPFTNGEPLCTYIQTTLRQVSGIDDIYVYCSDDSVKEYVLPGIKYLKRSADLDRDETGIIEVLTSFSRDVPADVYVLCHATAPFVSADSIQEGLDAVLSGRWDSSFSATLMQDFLWSDDRPMNYSLTDIPRTQDLPPLYVETSGFYIYTNTVIGDMGRRIGNSPKIIEVNKYESIDIDEKEDFEMADAWYNYTRLKNRGKR